MHQHPQLKPLMKQRKYYKVKCQYDDYYKDMQRLVFAEYYHISRYQELNQCLEQLPDGSNMDEKVWKIERDKMHNMKLSNGINNS